MSLILSTRHLPDSIQEMVNVVGLPATLKIVEERGGITLCVPTKVKADNWLTKLIGENAMKSLVKYYSGEEIEIPLCQAAIKAAQDEEIYQNIQKGISQAKLAREFGYTERGIRKLKKRMEQSIVLNQSSLF
jgi:hypothetical protein